MQFIPGYGFVPIQPNQQGQQPQVIYMPQPPATALNFPKKGRKASLKQMFKAQQEIEQLIKAVQESKNKDKKDDKKKREGLNWVEMSLALVFISLPIAACEIIGAIALIKATGLFKLING